MSRKSPKIVLQIKIEVKKVKKCALDEKIEHMGVAMRSLWGPYGNLRLWGLE